MAQHPPPPATTPPTRTAGEYQLHVKQEFRASDLVRVLVDNGLAAQEYSSRYAQAKRIADLDVRGRPVPDEARPSKQQLQDVAWWVRRKKIPPLEAIQDQLEAEHWLEAMEEERIAVELEAE